MNILFIGDIVGGRAVKAVSHKLFELREKYRSDIVIANAENAAGGLGITPKITARLYDAGIDVITLGNHAFSRPEIIEYISADERLLRPINMGLSLPGEGSGIFLAGTEEIAVINLVGQVYMPASNSPFEALEYELVKLERCGVKNIIVDFHAEASAEKIALMKAFSGKVSAVLGTHTHVQTADERIDEGFTAYISDVGMTGPEDGVIGMDTSSSLRRMRDKLPSRYKISEGRLSLNAVSLEIDSVSGACRKIERIQMKLKE